MKFAHLHTFSGRGDAPDQFRVRVTGLTVAADGMLYAAGDREVKAFTPGGELHHGFATSDAAWSIAAADDGLWLGMQGRLEKVDLDGKALAAIEDPARLGLITGLAAAGDRLLLGDATHKRLHLYSRGEYLRRVGDDVNTRGFMIPNGVLTVAYDPRESAFVVAHPQKHRIERYDLDGALLGKFGRFGHDDPAAFGGCCNPTTCGATPAGVVLATEKAPPRVKAFTSAGAYLAMTAEDAFDPGAKNQFVAAGRSGLVYATDSVRGTIEAFELDDT